MEKLTHNGKLTKRAQELRKNMTRQERHLWYDFLSTYPIIFGRQVTVDRYILDFYCASKKIAIELDGSQHYSAEGMTYDTDRTAVLQRYGIQVLRFSNLDVDCNFRGVCEAIDLSVNGKTSSVGCADSFPRGEA